MPLHISTHGTGFPLVFFHGWGFDSRVWFSLVPQLRAHYQLTLVDLPGFGQTPMMEWDLFKYTLLNQLPKRFALVGWSMGGLYAMRLAVEHSERVAHLMSISSSPRFVSDDLWPGVPKHVFKEFYLKLSANPQSTLMDFLKLHAFKIEDKFQCIPDNLPSTTSLEFGLKILETWDLRAPLKELAVQACFMFARLDPIVPVKTMHHMQTSYPQFNYILFPRAAHMPFLSHADVFIQELRRRIP